MQFEIEAQLPSRGFTLIQHMLAFGWLVFCFFFLSFRIKVREIFGKTYILTNLQWWWHVYICIQRVKLIQFRTQKMEERFLARLCSCNISEEGTNSHSVIALSGLYQEGSYVGLLGRILIPKQRWKTKGYMGMK